MRMDECFRAVGPAYKVLLASKLNTSQALEKLKSEHDRGEDVEMLIRFIEVSERGVLAEGMIRGTRFTMEQTAELRDAIEKLYMTFARYPLRENTDACPCCHGDQDERRVHAKPLRKLNANDLREFVQGALHVWGGVDDFKHFLPRIFELAMDNSAEFADTQIALGKLRYCEWWSWPECERQVVQRFFRAAWNCALAAVPTEWSGIEIEDLLCGITLADNDVAAYLTTWQSMRTEDVGLHLASFVANTDFAKVNQRPWDYWNDCPESFVAVAAWIRSEAVKTRLRDVADRHPECGFGERAYLSLR